MKRSGYFYIFILLVSPLGSFAAEIQWKQQYYSHFAEKESLESVLKDLMYGEGVAVTVSKKANADINMSLEQMPPNKVLEHLASIYQFVWYFYGRVLYVYDMTEIQTATVKLIHILPETFTETVKEMEIYDNKFSWYVSNQSGIVRFTGPKRLVELVMETAKIVDTDAPKRGSQFVYRWKDKKGGRHFSSSPPSGMTTSYEVVSLYNGEITQISR